MFSADFGAAVAWWVLTLGIWVGTPAAVIYVVRRCLHAYERRTEALGRAASLEHRIAQLEARVAAEERRHPPTSRAT